MIQVFHNANFLSEETYISFFKDEFVSVSEEQLSLVAEVDTEDLQTAFRLTNTVETEWWTQAGVTYLFTGDACRSTSVGDVLELNGTYYAVAPLGFKEVQLERGGDCDRPC